MEKRIRRARMEEREALTLLALRSKASWGYDEAFMTACREELVMTSERMRGWVEVAESKGERVGFIELKPENGGRVRVVSLFVDPDHMGEGWGRRLWDRAVSLAERKGCQELILDADPHAEEFYSRMGAKTVGKVVSGSITRRMLPLMRFVLPPNRESDQG
ncbi:GNAT family N-acetyltransferase [Salinithrix halophila]|uniref:GNAT family N-acetyltransferase n=1 Tax=Salinithrix halophila TaxID=1485204 RepID=A0ABV8JAH5_9BACL